MSLPEAPAWMQATSGTPPSTLEQEVTGPHATALSAVELIDLLKAELRNVRIERDETNIQLIHCQICHQSEAKSREILQRGLDVHQQAHFQLVENYKSIYEECDRKKTILQKDLRIANDLIESQKQLISIYQGQQQQQQPASHLVQGGPLLSQYNDHNYSCQYLPYQPPRSHEFVIDPAGLRPLEDFDYSIGSPLEPCCGPDPVMSTPVTGFENQAPIMSIQSMLHPTSAERDIPGPTHTKSEETKRGLEDEGVKPSMKPSKKQRTK